MSHLMHRPGPTLPIWLGYLLFVVYGSLVPLAFTPLSFDQAWAIFQHMPMLKLGVASRADWISNGVLYVPVGFLTAHGLIERFGHTPRAILGLLAGVFAITMALSIEFAQVFFPQRTVSLNDILAECIGSLLGVVLAAKYSNGFQAFLRVLTGRSELLARRLIEAYLLAYIAFGLFPYDILLSATELEAKWQGNHWGWLWATDSQSGFLLILKLVAESVLTLPFGLFLAYRQTPRASSFKQIFMLGLLFGALIEIAQFFMASGSSQGLSVLTRGIGFCGGLALWQQRARWSPDTLALYTRRFTPVLAVVYLGVLLQMNGWFSQRWSGMDFAWTQLEHLHFLPFYYHYFGSESKALFSLASVCLMYLPLGLLVWARRSSPACALFCALVVASLVETGKLFLQGMHPDPTNLLIASGSAWATAQMAAALATATTTDSVQAIHAMHPAHAKQKIPRNKDSATHWKTCLPVAPILLFAIYYTATFPTHPLLLSLGFVTCAILIWQHPTWLVIIIAAALPILDLAPWSGRFFLDEFDLLLMICLGVGYIRLPPAARSQRRSDFLLALASGLLLLSFAISALRGLIPWAGIDANAFTNYYSPFNALRIAKGALWAYLTFRLLQRMQASGFDIKPPLAHGMVAGLAFTVAVIIWERKTFSGLNNFVSDYRITGPFSAMHTGGAYVECYLTLATPFLILLILQCRNWINRMLGVLLLFATTYALMVTFSRNGYLAFAVAVTLILFFSLCTTGRAQRIFVGAMAGAILAIAIPVFTGPFAQQRMATVNQDYAVRQAHWQDALVMRMPDRLTTLFGMGLGRYPQSHYLFSTEPTHAGSYQLKHEDGTDFLRLSPGDPAYIEQIVAIKPQQNYRLTLNLRSSSANGEISAFLCEKSLLASFNCTFRTLKAGRTDRGWSRSEIVLSSGAQGSSPWYAHKTVKFGLQTPPAPFLIDVADVQLETLSGENLLRNGDFSRDMDHWFFSADNHLQWHVKSLPIAVIFDQGWFGLVALCAFLGLAIKRASVQAWQGDLHIAAWLAALSGFLVVGVFDTLIDAPRFLFLFVLLGYCCSAAPLSAPKPHPHG